MFITTALSFPFPTVSFPTGSRHLKFWDLSSLNPAASNAQLSGTKASQMLQRGDSNMVEACLCTRTEGGSYSLSHDGFLCMFDHQRALTKWVDVKVNTFFHKTFTLCFLLFLTPLRRCLAPHPSVAAAAS